LNEEIEKFNDHELAILYGCDPDDVAGWSIEKYERALKFLRVKALINNTASN
jgi:hypothetical protein